MRYDIDPNVRRIGPSEPVIRSYPVVILRGKWTILAMCAAFLLIAALITKLQQPVYQATASVLIQTQRLESGIFNPALASAIVTNIRQNELEVLRSQSLADTVAKRLIALRYLDSTSFEGIRIIQPARDEMGQRSVATVSQIVKRMRSDLEFVTVRESDVIKIIARSSDPREAALLANIFTRAYYDRTVFKSREQSRAMREFLQEQVQEQRRTLDQTETALQQYMENKGIVSLDDEARKMIEQLSELEANRDITKVTLQSSMKRLSSYENEIPNQEKMLAQVIGESNDPYIRLLQEQIAALEVQHDIAVARNPQIVDKEAFSNKLKETDDQIKRLRQGLKKRTDEYMKSIVPSASGNDQNNTSPSAYLRQTKQKMLEAQGEIQSLEAKQKALDEGIKEYEKQFARIPSKSIKFARLQRTRLSTEKIYLMLNDKYNEATIAEQSQFGHIEIIDHALEPTEPASPIAMLNLGIGLALGLVVGIVTVIAREHRDRRIHTPEDMERKGFALAAVVLRMDREIQQLKETPLLAQHSSTIDTHLVTLSEGFSPVAEAYRMLRTHLEAAETEHRPLAILVSSSNQSEGKSVTAANLAIVCAQSGKKVLLIDADMRLPTIHTIFDLNLDPGLSNYLVDKVPFEDVVQSTITENLQVVTAGSHTNSPAELIGSENMRQFLNRAKLTYDLVLFDSPPVLVVTDASVLAKIVDSVVMVVSAGSTRMEELERAVGMLERVSGRVPKYVLNRFDHRKAYGLSYGRTGYGYKGYGELFNSSKKNGENGTV